MTPENPPPRPIQLRVSEVFASIQGEGISCGEPCAFLRLAHCNLRCRWCDTKYTWDFDRHAYAQEVRVLAVPDVLPLVHDALAASQSRRLVITGGEPLLQQDEIVHLLSELPRDIFLEVETNGTLRPVAALLQRIDQFNVSPKLDNCGEPESRRLVDAALRVFSRCDKAWFKFVLESDAEVSSIESLLARYAIPKSRASLMAQAADTATLRARGPWVERVSQEHGFRYSPRLHVERWGGRRGV